MVYRKITDGYVIQSFNDQGECLGQRFVALMGGWYEDEESNPINVKDMPFVGNEYFPFDMVQPKD